MRSGCSRLDRNPRGEPDIQALLRTDIAAAQACILEWFVLRWQLEVTSQEVRAHLGLETQRQLSGRAIALLRRHLWIAAEGFSTPPPKLDGEKVPAALYARLLDSLAYAASVYQVQIRGRWASRSALPSGSSASAVSGIRTPQRPAIGRLSGQ